MVVVWSVASFIGLWLLLLGMGWVVGITIGRLEKDDGLWRRGL